MLKNSFLSTFVFMLVFTGCESWFDNGSKNIVNTVENQLSDNNNNIVTTEEDIGGTSVDGYLRNAMICMDTNGDFICNEDEKVFYSDENGGFTVTNVLKKEVKHILVIGGTDSSMEEEFDNILSYVADFSAFNFSKKIYISPMSNLQTFIYESEKDENSNIDYSELLNQISTRIKTDFDLNDSFDESDPMENNNLFAINQKVMQFVEIISEAVVQNSDANTTYSKKDLNKAFATSLKKLTKINNFEPSKIISNLDDSLGVEFEGSEDLISFLNEVDAFYEEVKTNTEKIDLRNLQKTVNQSIRSATKNIKKVIKTEFVKIKNTIFVENIVSSNMLITVEKNQEINSSLSAFSKNEGNIEFNITKQPENGELLNFDSSSGFFTFKALNDFVGNDYFTFKAKIQVGANIFESESNVTVLITPEQQDSTLNIAEKETFVNLIMYKNQELNSSLAVEQNSIPVRYEVDKSPNNGVLTIDSEQQIFIYTPNTSFLGQDSFIYKVINENNESDFVNIFVSVEVIQENINIYYDDDVEINVKAEDTFVELEVKENNPLIGTLIQDTNSSIKLQYSLMTDVKNGELILNYTDTQFKYSPNEDFYGTDSFIYKGFIKNTDEKTIDEVEVVVNIKVIKSDYAPEVSTLNFTVKEDELLSTRITFSAETDVLFEVTSSTQNGVLSDIQTNGAFNYDPNDNFNGQDSFEYVVTDSNNKSSNGKVIIDVISVGDIPVAKDLEFSTIENVAITKDLGSSFSSENIIDNSTHKVEIKNTQNGTASISNGFVLNYTPNNNFNGTDEINYQLVNEFNSTQNLYSEVKTIKIIVSSVFSNQSFNIQEDTILTESLDADYSNSVDEYKIKTYPKNGTVTIDNSNLTFTYEPKANYFGSDSFSYYLADENNLVEVNITIHSVEDAPSIEDAYYKMSQEANLTAELTVTDPDSLSSDLSFAITQNPSVGSVKIFPVGDKQLFEYIVNTNSNILESFEVTVTDQAGLSDTATIDLNVTNENYKPVIISPKGNIIVEEDSTFLEDVVTLDPDDNRHFIYHIGDGASEGEGVIKYDAVRDVKMLYYKPAPNWYGEDYLQYYAADSFWEYDLVDVYFTVKGVPDVYKIGCISDLPDKNSSVSVYFETNTSLDGNQTYEYYFSDENGSILLDSDSNKIQELISQGARVKIENNIVTAVSLLNGLVYDLRDIRVVAYDSLNDTKSEPFAISDATFDISNWWITKNIEDIFKVSNLSDSLSSISLKVAGEIIEGDPYRQIAPTDIITIHLKSSDGNYIATLSSQDLNEPENESIRAFMISIDGGSEQIFNLDSLEPINEDGNQYEFIYQVSN